LSESSFNPFEVLGINASPAVTDEMVRDAWRKAVFECHPDRHPNDTEAAKKFARVQEAYDCLRTSELRASAAAEFGMAYETTSRSSMRSSFDDFFRNMDREAEIWKRRPYEIGPKDGLDLQREVSISLEQAFRGGVFRIDHKAATCDGCQGAGRIHKRFASRCPSCGGEGSTRAAEGMIRVKVECPTCVGRGKVTWQVCEACGGVGQVAGVSANVEVPPGVDTGFEIKLPGLGAPGVAGGRAGGLTVVLRVLEDRVFQRRDADLMVRVRVPVWDAALGSRRRVKGIDGRMLEFDVPAGCRHGQIRSLRGEGMSTLEGARGNLLVKLDIVVPDAAGDDRMRDLFRQMREIARETGNTGSAT
jgi:molecular chaperone DnaJ